MDISDVYEMKGGRVLGTGVTGAVRVVQHKLTGKEYAHFCAFPGCVAIASVSRCPRDTVLKAA